VIYGLGAAIFWGLADLFAAFSGRRVGVAATVLISQVAAAVAISVVVLASGDDLDRLSEVAGWLLPIAAVTAVAYVTLYRALELGPIALVSPLLASYAVIPVLLAVIFLGESLGPVEIAGAAVTIGGAVVTSADVRSLRTGTRVAAAALPWALASTILFGTAAYAVAWSAKRVGWLTSLWLVRTSTALLFVMAAVVVIAVMRPALRGTLSTRAVALCALLGLADLTGTISYSRGSEVGLVSIVTAVSATYPLIPVFGGIALLDERPAINHYVGVAMVIAGLLLLGA
jgi:drug/metabolite transporter (DMT)-like permease